MSGGQASNLHSMYLSIGIGLGAVTAIKRQAANQTEETMTVSVCGKDNCTTGLVDMFFGSCARSGIMKVRKYGKIYG